MHHDMRHFDLFGVGIGPFNLSIAALAQGIKQLNTGFADSHASMTWHPGLLLAEAKMQTSPFKDMVTAVAPTSPLSFLSYLVDRKKIYAFMAAQMDTISRVEFADYLAWVAEKLDNLSFNNPVEAIEFSGNQFLIHSQQGLYTSQHICLGTGKAPHVPKCCQPHMGKRCLHAGQLALEPRSFTGKKIAVIGGGQTGADVFLNLQQKQWGEPSQIIWITRRPNFQSLDEGVFSDQYFTPNYGDAFYSLNPSVKQTEVQQQKLSSDGITQVCLNDIYQLLYQQRFVEKNSDKDKWQLKPHRTLFEMQSVANQFALTLRNGLTQTNEMCMVDEVILCTGFESKIPDYLSPIKSMLDINQQGQFNLNRAFSMNWDGPSENRVYAVNAGAHSHGILEPQLSLTAWRSATILNDVLGYAHFNLELESPMIDWGDAPQSKSSTNPPTKSIQPIPTIKGITKC